MDPDQLHKQSKGGNQDLVENMDDLDEEDFEISNYNNTSDKETVDFDETVGYLQDIVISTDFEKLQNSFFKQNYSVFENTEENKFEYMTIFKKYGAVIESYIEKELIARKKDFDMNRFLTQLEKRNGEIDEQLLDTLYSFSDFQQFKQLILDYKKQFEEEEKIEVLKTIKTTKKNAQTKKQPTKNIFADKTQMKPDFLKADPLNELKNLKIDGSSKPHQLKQPQVQHQSHQQQQQPLQHKTGQEPKFKQMNIQQIQQLNADDIIDNDLVPEFFIDCKGLGQKPVQPSKQMKGPNKSQKK